MNFNDPSLYAVTPRETSVPFVGGHPFTWPGFARFAPPFQAYGMQPFQTYGMQPPLPYWMQQSWMQPIAPFAQFGQFGALPYPTYGTQQFVPPTYGTQQFVPPTYGYGMPFQGNPCPTQGASIGLPYLQSLKGWERPFWY